ncbi:hypothetical protein DLREEDagrD3_21190 [Denitratisoma sp. agr-D3]
MQFKVSFKGISRFTGTLVYATRFIEQQWGSLAKASEIGVKLQPVPRFHG